MDAVELLTHDHPMTEQLRCDDDAATTPFVAIYDRFRDRVPRRPQT